VIFHWLDKIEVTLIKTFLVLAILLVLCQCILHSPRFSQAFVLLNRLEGIVYTYGENQ